MTMPNARPLPLGRCPVLRTDRLTLRGLRDEDAPAIALLANDREIARRMSRLPHPYGIEDARFYLREVAPDEMAWGITADDDRTLLGIAGLVPHAADDRAELGYWLGRGSWGKGIATEAARAIVVYGFDELGLPALASGCFTDNVASRQVLRKLGFIETGRSERACLAEGRDLPFVEMRLEAAGRLPA